MDRLRIEHAPPTLAPSAAKCRRFQPLPPIRQGLDALAHGTQLLVLGPWIVHQIRLERKHPSRFPHGQEG